MAYITNRLAVTYIHVLLSVATSTVYEERNVGLETVPREVLGNTNLCSLDLSDNKLTCIPSEIGNLQQLQELCLGHNKLTCIPPEIGNLQQLQLLCLHYNELTCVPAEIVKLVQLKRLYLAYNKLTCIPAGICDLLQLLRLYLNNNQLTCIPAGIFNLRQLTGLSFDNNKITSLPVEIGDLLQLTHLGIRGNQLACIPAEIGNLMQLQELYLDNNEITSLPVEIGDLLQLQYLCLSHNRLTSLPLSIRNITGMITLDLRGNPLVEYGEGETLGWRELGAIFPRQNLNATLAANIVITDNWGKARAPMVPIDKNVVYEKMSKKHVYWNVDAVKQMRLDTLPQHTLDGNAMLGMWNDALREYSTDAFIRGQIASLKHYMFEITVTPAGGSQNVHVLNYWKYKMQHELGIVSELSTETEKHDREVLYGNVLDAFYSKFTPNYVCGKLMEMINSDQARLNDACDMLHDMMDDEKSKRQVLYFNSDVPAGMTQRGVEEVLVRMDILRRNKTVDENTGNK